MQAVFISAVYRVELPRFKFRIHDAGLIDLNTVAGKEFFFHNIPSDHERTASAARSPFFTIPPDRHSAARLPLHKGGFLWRISESAS